MCMYLPYSTQSSSQLPFILRSPLLFVLSPSPFSPSSLSLSSSLSVWADFALNWNSKVKQEAVGRAERRKRNKKTDWSHYLTFNYNTDCSVIFSPHTDSNASCLAAKWPGRRKKERSTHSLCMYIVTFIHCESVEYAISRAPKRKEVAMQLRCKVHLVPAIKLSSLGIFALLLLLFFFRWLLIYFPSSSHSLFHAHFVFFFLPSAGLLFVPESQVPSHGERSPGFTICLCGLLSRCASVYKLKYDTVDASHRKRSERKKKKRPSHLHILRA